MLLRDICVSYNMEFFCRTNIIVNKNYGHYLNKDIHSSFTFMNIDEDAINKIIYNLRQKVVVDVMVFPPNC